MLFKFCEDVVGSMFKDHSFKTLANFSNFWPLPPYHQHSSKILMKGIFDLYVHCTFGLSAHGDTLPPRHVAVLNGWSLIAFRNRLGIHWSICDGTLLAFFWVFWFCWRFWTKNGFFAFLLLFRKSLKIRYEKMRKISI